MIRLNIKSTAKNEKLIAEYFKRYFFESFGYLLVYSLNVIRLARDDMSVPTPPMFTPIKSKGYDVVKLESNIADGTLLMNWHDKADTKSTFLFNSVPSVSWNRLILDTLPEKMKKQMIINAFKRFSVDHEYCCEYYHAAYVVRQKTEYHQNGDQKQSAVDNAFLFVKMHMLVRNGKRLGFDENEAADRNKRDGEQKRREHYQNETRIRYIELCIQI